MTAPGIQMPWMRTTCWAMSAAKVKRCRARCHHRARGASRPCLAPVDEFVVVLLADDELVLARLLEAVAAVEPLRAVVFGPHADPQRARTVTLEPGQGLFKQLCADAAALCLPVYVEPLEFAVFGSGIFMRQATGTGQRITQRLVAFHRQPDRVQRAGQQLGVGIDRMGFVEERLQVFLRIQMGEGVDERARAQLREHGGVGGLGAADQHAQASSSSYSSSSSSDSSSSDSSPSPSSYS